MAEDDPDAQFDIAKTHRPSGMMWLPRSWDQDEALPQETVPDGSFDVARLIAWVEARYREAARHADDVAVGADARSVWTGQKLAYRALLKRLAAPEPADTDDVG